MGTKRYIKSVLLDQTVLAGLGNIYVDEALFKACIHPERLAQSLSKEEVKVLYEQIIVTLAEAVEKGRKHGPNLCKLTGTNGNVSIRA